MSSFPRDLLRSLPPLHPQKLEEEVGETEEDVELSLGLSLNGRFGVDTGRWKRKQKLSRSSSIPDFVNPSAAVEAAAAFSASLFRTVSLPDVNEEDCRKRREIQSLRRLEAKRKRTEKLSCGGSAQDRGDSVIENGSNGVHGKPRTLSQQGSVGSQGSGTGSSGISSDSDIHQQLQESAPKSLAVERPAHLNNGIKGNCPGLPPKGVTGMRNVLEEMPHVFAKGDGPDGKRVEGFLYRYRKGEEVRIVCVCHGSFLSPAEFVRHAGGGDVANPMRHIVVVPSSLL